MIYALAGLSQARLSSPTGKVKHRQLSSLLSCVDCKYRILAGLTGGWVHIWAHFALEQFQSLIRTRGRERLLHALNKDSGEMLLVAHGQDRPKQDDYNRQRKPCWRH